MKILPIISISFLFLASCKMDSAISLSSQPDKIDGLELTFIKTNIQNSFTAICFTSESAGYIAGSDGTIFKSNDGAISWTALQTNNSLAIHDLCFLSADEGFAVGGESNCGGAGCVSKGAFIIHTRDGGQTWNQLILNPSEIIELNSICFADDSLGFAVGGGLIFTTHNRGNTWKESKIGNFGGIMLDVKFVNKNNGLISGTFGKLLKTTDGGITWDISSPFPPNGANTLALADENLVFSAGYSNIEKSSDFGRSWIALQNYPTEIFKLIFTSPKIGYAFGLGDYSGGDWGHGYGAIYYTIDGGLTWKGNKKIEEVGLIESASFPSLNVGYAISGNVVIKLRRL